MKMLFSVLTGMRAVLVCENKGFQYRSLVFLLVLSALGGLSSCHRAPYAYYLPTHERAPQRVTAHELPSKSASDPVLTASLDEAVSAPAKSVWEETAAPALKPVSATDVYRPAFRQQVKRKRLGRSVPPSCDQIVLRNGDVIEAKIKEVGVNEIKYKKCDRQDGPDYTISKRDVLSIKYTNGDVERFNATTSSSSSSSSRSSYDSPTNGQQNGPRTDPFAIVAIATGGLAILTGYGAFLLGAAAIVFGALSLSRIRKEPGRFKGKGLALGGMIAGIVSAGIILLYILL
ncbi:DUF4190 domain-containing protein [Larkinella knui]|uniref:DUF4190 domain-containing protein n=1 Tax=Larkinella knui TaxID=2025310 RepID=A0A3P1CCG0_9BACT|nr:DUF4190 domain-containing protein [Larkinella knui]RRB10965.1 DUF4190 domain-containing protein [Larkinella knui]